ncbi:MAG: TlpA disulfide reductase family protein [Gammaproteobacteria bacterium]|nr:TlpA disulfide reductase family protein [Gammaproteobacteria bacterium]
MLAACLGGCSAEQPAGLAGGGEVRFSELSGRWLLINYWAEWCAPCRDEIPELNELHERRDEHAVAVFGVNYDEVRGEKLVELMERMDVRFPVLTEDPRARWGYEQPDVLPVTVVIGPDGALRQEMRGPQTLDRLLAAIGEPARL